MKKLVGMKLLLSQYVLRSDSEIDSASILGYGQNHLEDVIRSRVMQTTATGTIPLGSVSMPLPGDFLEFDNLVIIDGATRYVFEDYRDINYLVSVRTTETGLPKELAHFEDTLYFDRYTDRLLTFELKYYRRLPNFGDIALSTPVNATFTAGSGTLTEAATHYYRVSAFNGWGQTLASTETFKVVTSTGGINVNWAAVSGAHGYKIYGRTTSAELLMATVYGEQTTTWLDDGSVTPAGALPSANTTAPEDSSSNYWSQKYEEALLLSSLVKLCRYLIEEPREKQWKLSLEEEIAKIKANEEKALPKDSTIKYRGYSARTGTTTNSASGSSVLGSVVVIDGGGA